MQTKGLTVGQRIRMTRKYLGIKQYEITSGKITRNLISAIENDKVRLTPDNARLIYDNLNRFAKERNMEIDLDLSEVLGDDPVYQAEMRADQYIEGLKNHLRSGSFPESNLLYEIEQFMYEWNIPVKKASLYEVLGDLYAKKCEFLNQLFYQTKAFEYYSVEKYDNCLPLVSAKISAAALELKKPEIGKRFIDLCQYRTPSASRQDMYNFYLKSAQVHSVLGEHDMAITHIEKCIDRFTSELDESYYNAVSVKASCHLEKGEYGEAVQFFTHAANGYHRLERRELGIQQSIQIIRVLSDINYIANKHKVEGLVQGIEMHLKELDHVNHELSAFLAEMYRIVGNTYDAQAWTQRALDQYKEDRNPLGYFTVIDEQFTVLQESNRLDLVREEAMQTVFDMSTMPQPATAAYRSSLTKLLTTALASDETSLANDLTKRLDEIKYL